MMIRDYSTNRTVGFQKKIALELDALEAEHVADKGQIAALEETVRQTQRQLQSLTVADERYIKIRQMFLDIF